MSSSSGLHYPISPYVLPEKLWFDDSGTNYMVWKAHLIYLLQPWGLISLLDGTSTPPPETVLNPSDCTRVTNEDYITWRRKDQLLKEMISSLVEDHLEDDSSRGIWRRLDDKFREHLEHIENRPSTNARHERSLKYQGDYFKLSSAVQHNDWTIIEQIGSDAGGGTMREAALLTAVAVGKGAACISNLLVGSTITAKDALGNTALNIAAAVGNIDVATKLVECHFNLLYIPNILGDYLVHTAAKHARRGMLIYLVHTIADRDYEDVVMTAPLSLAALLTAVIHADFYNIALVLVRSYRILARVKGSGPSALESIVQRNHILRLRRLADERFAAYEAIDVGNRNWGNSNQSRLDLVQLLCKELRLLDTFQAELIYRDAILTAVEVGDSMVVGEILEAFPNALHCCNSVSRQNVAHLAVLNKHVEVFDLISKTNHPTLDQPDVNGNNILHRAARLAPVDRRLRHDVDWFKMVEKVVPPICTEKLNHLGKSSGVVFREEHAELRREAALWVINSAKSFIVVAILITTLTFAAAITVPSGNDSSVGHALFSERSLFKAFISVSFLFSVISLIALLRVSIKTRDIHLERMSLVLNLGWSTLRISIVFLVAVSTLWLLLNSRIQMMLLLV